MPSLCTLKHSEATVQDFLSEQTDMVLLVLPAIAELCSHSVASTDVTQAFQALEAMRLGTNPADDAGIV